MSGDALAAQLGSLKHAGQSVAGESHAIAAMQRLPECWPAASACSMPSMRLRTSSGKSLSQMSPLLVWMMAPRGSSTAGAGQGQSAGNAGHRGAVRRGMTCQCERRMGRAAAAALLHAHAAAQPADGGREGDSRAEGPAAATLLSSAAAASSPTGRSLNTSLQVQGVEHGKQRAL